ncbi:isopentenyl phosphate kinase [Candidatus Poseidonia alphae]|uniref:isopentenyl phosphate kinase n=1 Tax=Candidatus Poseidonia alphae TaxID=1915863 RepID=UPI0030C708E2
MRYAHGASIVPPSMRERVVIKWGGGLITKKEVLKQPLLDVIGSLADQILECNREGIDVILVHGAGSFGHLKAKTYRLAEGRLNTSEAHSLGPLTQDEAIEEVRNDMMELNRHIMDALTKRDISAVSLPPHQWANETGTDFKGSLEHFIQAPKGITMVTFGDVVSCHGHREFGILSGDDIVARLAVEVPDVSRLVFAIGGVDGVLAVPPANAGPEDLIEVLTPEHVFDGEHESAIDVTGGIGLKVDRGFYVASHGIDVIMVNGGHPSRVLHACKGRDVRGTKLSVSSSDFKQQ